MKKSLLLMTALMLSSCETVGNKKIENITEDNISEWVVIGLSDKSSVYEIFGDPLKRMSRQNGGEIWLYAIADLKPKPTNFVPVFGAMAPRYSGVQKSIIIKFGEDGVVENQSVSYSDISIKRGVGSVAQSL